MRALLLVALALHLAGCHFLLPLDASADGGPLLDDIGVADLLVARDTARDGPPDGAPPDAAGGDMPPTPADGGQDCTPSGPTPIGACVDTESKAAAVCTQPCPPLASDPDCDGLAGVQDPLPTQANPMLLGDGFIKDTVGLQWFITSTTCAGPSTSSWDGAAQTHLLSGCWWLQPSTYCRSVFTDPDYLLEARFTVSKIEEPGNWYLYLDFGTGMVKRYCRLEQTSTVAGGTPHIQINFGSGFYKPIPSLEPVSTQVEGKTFILQGYSARNSATGVQEHHCRLLTGDGAQVIEDAPQTGDVATPTPLAIRTKNLSIAIDHVRAYQLFDFAP